MYISVKDLWDAWVKSEVSDLSFIFNNKFKFCMIYNNYITKLI